tara:strand:+ start:9651 stop:10055 length:405 start_codon:yes stop_codon:yes gene_type:complete
MEKYLRVVNKHFGLDITEKTRKFEYVFARACYYYLCRKFGGFSYSKIGMSVNKNHATVLHGLKELPYMIKHDDVCLKKYNALMSKFDVNMCVQKNTITVETLVRDYNFLLLENDKLRGENAELRELIYKLADLD